MSAFARPLNRPLPRGLLAHGRVELAEPEQADKRRRRTGFRLTANYQVTGWRFLHRRLQHALIRRDTRMIDDPQKAQSAPLILGMLLAVVVCVGALVLSLFSPAGLVKDARIVADKDSGALYVRIGDRLDPVTNLTSARLIAGTPANPVRVSTSEIAKYPRGSLVGIVGAPVDMRDSNDPWSIWTVCDTTMTGEAVPLDPVSGLPTIAVSPLTTTVIGGALSKDQSTTVLGGNQARLFGDAGRRWLVYPRPDGVVVRSLVNLNDRIVADALGLQADDPVLPISPGLLNAVPAEPPLVAPAIDGVGSPSTLANDRPLTVGTILKSADLSGQEHYYVTLKAGVQEVSFTAATMIRAANPQVSFEPVEASPTALASFPKTNELEVSFYPNQALELVSPSADPMTCWSWSHHSDWPAARTEVLVGPGLPLTAQQRGSRVQLVSAPTSGGKTADFVSLPPNTGRFVRITGAATDSQTTGSDFWVADNGVRFGLDTSARYGGADTLAALGLKNPAPAPWAVVSLFAPGATLSRRDALIRHDGVPPNMVVAGIGGTIDSNGVN